MARSVPKAVLSLLTKGLWATAVAVGLLGAASALLAAPAEEAVLSILPAVIGIGFATSGAFVASRQARNPVGWLLLVQGVISCVSSVGAHTLDVLGMPASGGARALGAWFNSFVWIPIVGLVVPLAVVYFPDGRLTRGRRILAWYGAVTLVLATLSEAVLPGPLEGAPAVENPFGFGPLRVMGPLSIVATTLFVLGTVAGTVSLAWRFLRSAGDERQQMKWVLAAAACTAIGVSTYLISPFPDLTAMLAFLTFPIAFGMAILKYRLYDINLVLNRTLVYVPLTAILAGAYLAAVGLVKALATEVTGASSDTAVAISTLVVVALFSPVKDALQAQVNKHFKEVRDPLRELKGYQNQVLAVVRVLDPDEVAKGLLQRAAATLDTTSGAVYLHGAEGPRRAAFQGPPDFTPVVRVPMEAGAGAVVGELVLGERAKGLSYSEWELAELRRCASAAARAIALSPSSANVVGVAGKG
jgi:hypothetical protein